MPYTPEYPGASSMAELAAAGWKPSKRKPRREKPRRQRHGPRAFPDAHAGMHCHSRPDRAPALAVLISNHEEPERASALPNDEFCRDWVYLGLLAAVIRSGDRRRPRNIGENGSRTC